MATSFISKKQIPDAEAISAASIREGIFNCIKKELPDFSQEHFISVAELNEYRRVYLASLLATGAGEMDYIDKEVMKAIATNSTLSENIEEELQDDLSLGQRMADKIASFGGSWKFIIIFFTFILGWMLVNIWFFATKPFDPYPFILLNLILSCLAAIQAPIIMMSQNRQEQKDRKRSEQDYKINLKAELEIQILSEKIDHLLIHQNKKLMEIQAIQSDYLEDLMKTLNKK